MAVFCKPPAKASGDGTVGRGVKFERIRRITGYLVGTLDRFNNAKRAEVSERVKHVVTREVQRDWEFKGWEILLI